MTAVPPLRPTERLWLIVSSACLVTALPVPVFCWLPYLLVPAVIVLAASAEARKHLVPYQPAEDARAVCVKLILCLFVWLPLSVAPFAVLAVRMNDGPHHHPPGVGLVAFFAACLPAAIAFTIVAEPFEQLVYVLRAFGLCQIAFAATLSDAPWVGALAVISLALLVLLLEPHRPLADRSLLIGDPVAVAPTRSHLLWLPLFLAAAVACVLLTPAIDSRFNPGMGLKGSSMRSFDFGVDLNQTGRVRQRPRVAFDAKATHADGSPKTDLPSDQRWRHQVYETYWGGRWALTYAGIPCDSTKASPDRGPGTYQIAYRCRSGAQAAPVAAEPVRLGRGEHRSPIVRPASAKEPLFFESLGTVQANPAARRRLPQYRQFVPGDADRMRTPAASVTEIDLKRLRFYPADALQGQGRSLALRLARSGLHDLNEAELQDLWFMHAIDETSVHESSERLCRAMTRYLRDSGQYSYTLERPREDLTIDPNLDFLANVKAGHCERFASALALMLREWAVPCRLVGGYLGAERKADGTYVVREARAHAWVEALVPRPGEPGEYDWLTLDPTPPGDGPTPEPYPWWWPFGDWEWGVSEWSGDEAFEGGDEEEGSWLGEVPWLTVGATAAGAVAVAVAVYFYLRRRRREVATSLYGRLLAVLRRHGYPPPRLGQTPREHAEGVGRELATEAPRLIVALHYRERFGGAGPTAEEANRAEEELRGLARALAKRWWSLRAWLRAK